MAVRAPDDRRFRRAKVKPTRRRGLGGRVRWRTIGRLAMAALVALAAYRGAVLVLGTSVFRVDHVVVRGHERLSTGEVLALVAGLRGQSLIGVDLAAYRTRLLDSPWVADAALRRLLPSTVEVLISERAPIGLGRIGSRLYLIDERGTLIDEYGPQYAAFDLPIVDGLAVEAAGGPTVDRPRAALAARLLAALADRPDLGARISQVDVADPHDAVVLLEGETALVHLGEARFAERLQSYVELAPALRERVPEIDYVDLRFDDRVYVRPSGQDGRTTPVARRY